MLNQGILGISGTNCHPASGTKNSTEGGTEWYRGHAERSESWDRWHLINPKASQNWPAIHAISDHFGSFLFAFSSSDYLWLTVCWLGSPDIGALPLQEGVEKCVGILRFLVWEVSIVAQLWFGPQNRLAVLLFRLSLMGVLLVWPLSCAIRKLILLKPKTSSQKFTNIVAQFLNAKSQMSLVWEKVVSEFQFGPAKSTYWRHVRRVPVDNHLEIMVPPCSSSTNSGWPLSIDFTISLPPFQPLRSSSNDRELCAFGTSQHGSSTNPGRTECCWPEAATGRWLDWAIRKHVVSRWSRCISEAATWSSPTLDDSYTLLGSGHTYLTPNPSPTVRLIPATSGYSQASLPRFAKQAGPMEDLRRGAVRICEV